MKGLVCAPRIVSVDSVQFDSLRPAVGRGFYHAIQHFSSGDAGRRSKEDEGQFLPRVVAASHQQVDDGSSDRSVNEVERVGLTSQQLEWTRVEAGKGQNDQKGDQCHPESK